MLNCFTHTRTIKAAFHKVRLCKDHPALKEHPFSILFVEYPLNAKFQGLTGFSCDKPFPLMVYKSKNTAQNPNYAG